MAAKIEFRLFFLPEYEAERAYLEDMHRRGWRFVRAWPYIYRFESCEPEEFAYEIDFRSLSKAERASYLRMTEDYGWEHVMDYGRFRYFRKKTAADARTEERELFSDDRTRAALARQIFRSQMIPVTIVFLVCLALLAARIVYGDPMRGADYILPAIFAALTVFNAYALIRCARGFIRLKRKYGGGSDAA